LSLFRRPAAAGAAYSPDWPLFRPAHRFFACSLCSDLKIRQQLVDFQGKLPV
jgi:hypothetical protein